MCVLGEGEITLIEVIRHLLGKIKKGDITGLAWREDSEVKISPLRPPIPNLDILPYPAWDIISSDDFLGPPLRLNQPASVILTSRGCPYNCVFCSNPVWKLEKPHYRARSPKNIVGEIELLYQKGFRELYIRSDEFNANLDWAIAVCKAIKTLNLKKMAFQLNLRADRVNDELVDLLAEINCWIVHIGIESANDRVLKGIKKHITRFQVEKMCRSLKSRGIKIFGFFMMFQAWEEEGVLSYETKKEVENSLSFAWHMSRQGLLDYMSWQVTTPIPGSELYNIALKYNLFKSDTRVRNMWESHLDLPDIDDKTIKRLRFKGMLLQSYLYLRSGRIQWRHWKKIVEKISYLAKSI
jgi:radical SAM superfamily enzyme YgiQ (UPF0313 family)